VPLPCSPTPAGERVRPLRHAHAAPALTTTKAPALQLSRLNHTASALAVYASQDGSPHHHARLASGCRPGSTGRASHPQGSYKRFQTHVMFVILLFQAFMAQGQVLQSNMPVRIRPPWHDHCALGRSRSQECLLSVVSGQVLDSVPFSAGGLEMRFIRRTRTDSIAEVPVHLLCSWISGKTRRFLAFRPTRRQKRGTGTSRHQVLGMRIPDEPTLSR
jgi:hypothetical protein